ncbi:MAG: HDIG domain-containing protein [Tindallia sp. MSAO_Bac2]|nr:MAG: HDIG domain-containing protein [Tindallia sp. MSAO_Bac2]
MGILDRLNQRRIRMQKKRISEKKKLSAHEEKTLLSRKLTWQYIALGLLFFVVTFYLMLVSLQPAKYDLRAGQFAPEDIVSPRMIVDDYTTERLREEAVNEISSVYRTDSAVFNEVKNDIDEFFDKLYDVKDNEEASIDEQMTEMEDNNLGITGVHLEVLLQASEERLKNIENYLSEIVAQRMNDGIKVAELQEEKSEIREFFHSLTELDEELKESAIAVINATIRPNQFMDVEATDQLREEAREAVDPVVIRRGDTLAEQGERITAETFSIMKELGLIESEFTPDLRLYAGISAVILLAMAVLTGYIWLFHPDYFYKTKRLFLLILIMLLVLISAKPISILSIYLIPLATGAMLLALLLEGRLALITNAILSILVAIMAGNDLLLLVMGLIGGTAGVLSMINTKQRGKIFFSGLVVGVSNVVIIISFGLIGNHQTLHVLQDAGMGMFNGVLCAVLAIGTLPFWEYSFSILTSVKLIELSNPSHPLLKKLLMEAPGTYHHSIVVGNLAEAAVNAIGGDGLLVRVGAFYHDIGKVKRPYFFKENQFMTENPHDKLAPSLSALIITGHTKDGVEIAEKNKLPQEIIAFIKEHHGTTLAAYFYHKAKQEYGDPKMIDEMMYRYQGPVPQTRETAVLMLADSAEAAVRSLESPNRDKIEQIVKKIIQTKLDDGQLEDSQLTLTELKEIRQVFAQMLAGIMHERIKYPEVDLKELKGRK